MGWGVLRVVVWRVRGVVWCGVVWCDLSTIFGGVGMGCILVGGWWGDCGSMYRCVSRI